MRVMSSATLSRPGIGSLWTGKFGQKAFLIASAICLGLGLISSYAGIQDLAERELALRLGPPRPFILQNFDPRFDIGHASEIAMHSEIDMSNSFVVASTAEASGSATLIVPLLPVSDAGAARLVEGQAGGEAALTQQEMRRAATSVLVPDAAGFLLVPFDAAVAHGQDNFFFAEAVYGEGQFGTVVTLNGEMRPNEALTRELGTLHASLGLTASADFIVIEPYLEGRDTALTKPSPSKNFQWFFVWSGVLAAISGLLHVCDTLGIGRARAMVPEMPYDDEPETVSHPKFARIPSQSEILAADRKIAEAAASREGANTPLRRALRAMGIASKAREQ